MLTWSPRRIAESGVEENVPRGVRVADDRDLGALRGRPVGARRQLLGDSLQWSTNCKTPRKTTLGISSSPAMEEGNSVRIVCGLPPEDPASPFAGLSLSALHSIYSAPLRS